MDFLNQRIKAPRRSWNPSRSSSHTFPSQRDFWLNALGMPCAFSGWTPRKKRTGMAAIFGADWADRSGWPLEFSSRKLASPCPMCLFAFFCFSVSICNQVRKHLADLGGPQYIDERTFHHFIKDWGFGLVPCLAKFHDVPGSSRRVFVKVLDMLDVAAISPSFGFQSILTDFLPQVAAPRRMNW